MKSEMLSKNKIVSWDSILDSKYGKPGTFERVEFEIKSQAFIIEELLKEEKSEANLKDIKLAEAKLLKANITKAKLLEKQGDKNNNVAIDEHYVSTKQKGSITENRVVELITLGSGGILTCYVPNSDDDGIDLIINPKGEYNPLFIQVKSRFVLQKSGQFIQNVGDKTFNAHEKFFLLFIYFNRNSFEVEKVWLIPSIEFSKIAIPVKKGETFSAFYRFAANPKSSVDKWAKYMIKKEQLGIKLLNKIEKISA